MLQALPSHDVVELGEPIESAHAAGLHYVHDDLPGITRRRCGKGFCYYAPNGARITDEPTLTRIRALAIPPAYTNVWIAQDPLGHIQATGRDAKWRKQYRYHPRWREVRDAVKYERMVSFAETLPKIRARCDRDLRKPGMTRERVLSLVVRLLETTRIRVGNEEYARKNRSFGLTTLLAKHVHVEGSAVRFTFRGKSGKHHHVSLRDRRLSRVVSRCLEIPGQELFTYVDCAGLAHAVSSGDVNEYLRQIAEGEFTAKDFRTWAGTVLAAERLRQFATSAGHRITKRAAAHAIVHVSEHLGNTPAVCKRSYIHPAVLDAYFQGAIAEVSYADDDLGPHELSPSERFTLALLREKATAALSLEETLTASLKRTRKVARAA